MLSVWRKPSFDPYASWTAFLASETWVRRVVADQSRALSPVGDLQTYIADILTSATIAPLVDQIDSLSTATEPPRASGVVLDGMCLGIRTARTNIWWHSHLETPFNAVWLHTFRVLDTGMPSCTVAIQNSHQWIEAT